MKLNYLRLSEHKLTESLFKKAMREVSPYLSNNWWDRNKKKKERALRNLLINLQVCEDAEDNFGEVAVHRTRAAYSQVPSYVACHFKYEIYIPLIDALVQAGWCYQQKGWKDEETGKGFITRLKPNKGKIEELRLKDSFIDSPLDIELRNTDKQIIFPPPMTQAMERAEKQLLYYNSFMRNNLKSLVYYEDPRNLKPLNQSLNSDSSVLELVGEYKGVGVGIGGVSTPLPHALPEWKLLEGP